MLSQQPALERNSCNELPTDHYGVSRQTHMETTEQVRADPGMVN